MRLWWQDFNWSWRGVVVKDTGAKVSFSADVIGDVLTWLVYYVAEHIKTLFCRPESPLSICYLPRPPRPWYLFWAAAFRAGLTPASHLNGADAALYFDDNTYSDPPALMHKPARSFNFECRDISKSYVATLFEEVFGYDLSVDPENYTGPMVVKSEKNGAHDGAIINGPCARQKGWVYQRVVDNTSDGHVHDIRCPTIFGEIPLIYIKSRPITRRFDNMNATVKLVTPDSQLSREERDKVALFCRKMGLDWGGLDILRDKSDGLIYIVDVNKTDMGPPLSLPLRDKLKSTEILGYALREAILSVPTMTETLPATREDSL